MNPTQVYKRARYVVDNHLQGLFYWDMGNDIPVTDDRSLARWCSYGLNSNVDTLVTSVEINHPTSVSALEMQGKINYDSHSNILSVGDCPVKTISVYNSEGALMMSSRKNYVELDNLPQGIYIAQVIFGNGEKGTFRLLQVSGRKNSGVTIGG